MGISLLNETKTKVSLSNESKSDSPVLNDIDTLINDADYYMDNYKMILDKETKSKISLSNETK